MMYCKEHISFMVMGYIAPGWGADPTRAFNLNPESYFLYIYMVTYGKYSYLDICKSTTIHIKNPNRVMHCGALSSIISVWEKDIEKKNGGEAGWRDVVVYIALLLGAARHVMKLCAQKYTRTVTATTIRSWRYAGKCSSQDVAVPNTVAPVSVDANSVKRGR